GKNGLQQAQDGRFVVYQEYAQHSVRGATAIFILSIADASRNGIRCGFAQGDINAIDGVARDLEGLAISGFLHSQAQRKDGIANVVIQFANNGSARHGAGEVDFLLAQLYAETNNDRDQGGDKVGKKNMGQQHAIVRDEKPVDARSAGADQQTTEHGNHYFLAI